MSVDTLRRRDRKLKMIIQDFGVRFLSSLLEPKIFKNYTCIWPDEKFFTLKAYSESLMFNAMSHRLRDMQVLREYEGHKI